MSEEKDYTETIQLSSRVGEGTSFLVYEGTLRDNDTEKKVAVKFCRDSVHGREKLEKEYEQHKRFSAVCEDVPTPIGTGTYNGSPISISCFCNGQTLYDLLSSRKIDTKKSIRLILNIYEWIHKVGQKKLSHSDLHLNNIMTDNKRFQVLDFDMANEGGEIFTKGKDITSLDENIFTYSLWYSLPSFRNKNWRKLLKRTLRKHIQKLRLFIHRIPVREWVEQMPCIHKGQTMSFCEYNERRSHAILWSEEKDDYVVAKPENIVANTSHEHIVYYVAHKRLPSFDTRCLRNIINNE